MSLSPEQTALVARYVEIKRALVGFATAPMFESDLAAVREQLEQEGGPQGADLDPQDLLIDAVEELLFEHRYPDGDTVLDRFVALPGLTHAEYDLVMGFKESVFAIFELLDDGGEVFALRSVFDGEEYLAVATAPRAVTSFTAGDFVRCRLLPLDGAAWVLSGRFDYRPASARQALTRYVVRPVDDTGDDD